MPENILDVRLLHAAKTLTAWNNTTSVPKIGEVCLEIQGNTPPLSYKIKIGDGTTSYALLPYFGSVINANGNASVVAVDTVTDGGITKKVLKFYKLTLTTSTTDGITTISPAIGDLILTIQEGTGINFATNDTDTLVEVELEAVTADTAQTISDGGTFTTVTKDSNDKATKYTTFTLPSITDKISELDVTDNTVITAEWDNTNKQIKLYYIKESDGKIQKGSLAYTINAIDIAPVQSITEGTKIDVSSSNGNYTITHESTTRTDTKSTKKSFGDSVVTRVSTDSTGHVTGVETSQLPDNPVIGLDMSDPTAIGNGLTFIDTISQSSGQVTATKKTVQDGNTTQKGVVQLQDSIDINNTKAATPNAVKSYTDTKITDTIEDLDSSQSADANNVLTSITQTDGKLTGKTQVSYTTIAPVQGVTTTDTGDSGIEITTSNNVKDVHHKTVVQDDTDTSSIIGEKELPVITGINVDSYGHITGVTKDISSNLIAADIKAPIKQTDNSMWNHRVTGGDISIGEDIAKIPVLKGNTLVWNQLLGEGTFVDMGLPSGNLWATSNIDVTQPNKFAASPFQYEGLFFSWGNIEGHNPVSTYAFDYNWGSVNSQEPWYDGQPYGDTAGVGLTTNIPVGETYDAARANLGAPWYTPQSADFQELVNNCIFINADGVEIPSDTTDKRVTVNGIVGLYLQSKTNGNRLFFACSGIGVGTSWNGRGSVGYYWSASFDSARIARSLVFGSGGVDPQNISARYYGFAVRAIAKTSDTIITDPNGHKYYVKNKQNVFDLTKMFGAGNEPTTVAEFEAMFPNSYYSYNEGELISLKPAGVKSTGFNQWDEEWEVGGLNGSGEKVDSSTQIRCKSDIPVFPNTEYYVGNKTYIITEYDSSGNFISRLKHGGATITITTSSNARYLRFCTPPNYGTTYNHDICINLSDTSRNGTYEPHKKTTLDLSWIKSIKDNGGNQLFPNGLLSAGDVYDEVGEDYAIKRIGVVDLGDLTWTYESAENRWHTIVSDIQLPPNNNSIANILSSVYEVYTINYLSSYSVIGIALAKTNGRLYVYRIDSSNQPTGILYYELATPITVTFDRKSLSYTVDDLGTETLLPEGVGSTTATPLSAPFYGQFEYKSNFKDTVLDLVERVNNARNPVKGATNTNQTVDKLAIYDSVETVKSSNYSPSNATIVEGATDNDIILPSVETVVNYVNTKLSSALNYKGTISQWSDLPTSGQNTGDMYIADTTFTEGSVTYQAGDFFIWNGTDWDIVSGTTSVVNSNPTLSLDGGTYQVGTVDGIALQVTTPNLDYSSPTASGTSLEYIDSVSQSNGLISATKKSLPNASTTQAGVTSFVTDIHYSTDNEKTATAKQIWVECEKRNVQFVEAGVVPTGLPMTEDEFINTYAYGVKWVQGSSECTRVGNSSLHETMPIHNALRACVYQIVPQEVTVTETIDGVDYTLNYGAKREFRYWLDDDDWNKKADGTPSVLTGEDMTGIAIWHPKFYGKSFDGVVDGSTSYNSVYVSLVQYDNTWTEIKEGYVDFAKMQTVSSNGVNYARSFGNPDFSVDNPSTTEMTLNAINTWIQTQKDSTQSLVKSQVNMNRLTANQYAMNAGAHLMSLDEYKWIFCWLPVIECAAFTVEENTHFDWQDGSDTNIVMRDSLSNVPSWIYYGMYSSNYSAIVETCGQAFVPAGYTNKLGTHTGWIKMRLPNSGGTYDSKIASRWRGFEIQRNIWVNFMGVNPVQTNTSGTVDVYSTKNRALWNNNMPIDITDESSSTHANIMPWDSRDAEEPEYTTLTGWEHKGVQKWNGYGTEFDLGSDGNPTYKTLGSSKPDYHYGAMSNGNPRWFIAGGSAYYASGGGPFYFSSSIPAGAADGNVGFRCCWNIDEYNSVLN